MNILVTGGAGFIGSHIAQKTLDAGHRVIVLDNLHTGHSYNVPEGADFYNVDIRDPAALANVYKSEQIEAISHQAAMANVRGSMENPQEYAEVNVIGTLHLLELARKHNCRKFIFASTGGAVYGEGFREDDSVLPFTEAFWPRPKDNYGATKLAMEFHIDLYHQNYGMEYVIFRYPNVYGPRQDSLGEAGVVAIFTAAMLANGPTRITGDGKQLRDFTFVGDIARANQMALNSDAVGIYNLGSGTPTDVNTIHNMLSEITGYGGAVEYVPQPVGEVRQTYLDSTKAWSDLKWRAEVPLVEGLQKTVEWFQSRNQ